MKKYDVIILGDGPIGYHIWEHYAFVTLKSDLLENPGIQPYVVDLQ